MIDEQEAVEEFKLSLATSAQALPDPYPVLVEVAEHIQQETPSLLPLKDLFHCLKAYSTLRRQFLQIQELASKKNDCLKRIAILMKQMESATFLIDPPKDPKC